MCGEGEGVCGRRGVCMARGVYVAGEGGMRGRIVGHSSGQYASYWNIFLYITFSRSAKIGRFLKKDFEINVISFVVLIVKKIKRLMFIHFTLNAL